MEKYQGVEQIVRRKAKRIDRARDLVLYLKYDISPYLDSEEVRDYFDEKISELLDYLTNDDKEENKYNYDNYN